MKRLICALIMVAAVAAMGAGFTISSDDSRSGGSRVAYGGSGKGDTGATNVSYAAVIAPAGRVPVLDKFWGYTETSFSNANPYGWGCIQIYVPTNLPIQVGAALSGTSNYVVSNTSEWTNAIGSNVIPSNTVMLAYSRSTGIMTRTEPWQGACGDVDPVTNIVLRHGVTLSSGDYVYPMHRIAVFPNIYGQAALSSWITNMFIFMPGPEGFVEGPIYGLPGKPLLIEAKGLLSASNKVVAVGHFE